MTSPPTKSRYRILFVIGSMGGGGAERQLLEIIKRLDRSRFEPVLYLAVKNGELLDEVPPDVPIFAFWDGQPEPLFRRLMRYIKLTRLMRQLYLAYVLRTQQIDLIYDRTYLATLDAASGCSFRPTRRVSCCVADPGPELELHVRFSILLAKFFARRAYQSASVVLANSQGLRKRVLEYFQLDPNHVKVVYNLLPNVRGDKEILAPTGLKSGKTLAVDLSLDASNESSSQEKLDPHLAERRRVDELCSGQDGVFLIVNAGRLHPQKGHRCLLEAIEELVHRRGRTLRLVIFGQGETQAELLEFVRGHQLESFVTLIGFVDDPRHWYQHADLFVLPSLFEGMPNALIEAIASGVPALSSNCPSGPSEVLDGGRFGGLVPPGDPIALANGIAEAMDHRKEWKSRAELARKHVERMFDPNAGIKRLESLFEQIIQGKPIEI